MDDWDWIIVLYVTVIFAIGALFWLYLVRPKPYPKDWVCDGCGQVCTELRHGLCNYCANFYKPTEYCRQRGK